MSSLIRKKCAICGKKGISGISCSGLIDAMEGTKITYKINMDASAYTKDCICSSHTEKEKLAFWGKDRKPKVVE